jgi:hypothetical protein
MAGVIRLHPNAFGEWVGPMDLAGELSKTGVLFRLDSDECSIRPEELAKLVLNRKEPVVLVKPGG